MARSVDDFELGTSKLELFAVFGLVQRELVGLPLCVLAHHELGLELSVPGEEVGVIVGQQDVLEG